MDLFAIILTVLGLAFFETITSIDNAIINAEVLSKMSERARKWFLVWGIVIAVVCVRGLLPGLILFAANPGLGPIGVVTAMFSSDPAVAEAIEQSSPILLMGGGVFLVFLFFHWLFLEPKHFGLPGEFFIKKQGVWFFAVVSVFLTLITWFAINIDPLVAFGAVVGSTAFFIVHGFKQNAELAERELLEGGSAGAAGMGDLSKLLYLEVIDATFSVDGVVGAFAFTLAVPLILVGNGIGAFVVREFTIRNIENVKKYIFLKNGAMYSILFLGAIMILDGFGFHIPEWLSPIMTFAIVGFFFWKSCEHLKKNGGKIPDKPAH
ncbi:DUF475 domain-containing protein [Candidatus Micrarchaeota archaeon]|nr:DUF475 domain-containing protein [Candidatus Micrarchaeota archaeon]